jgi:hypothetical protein
MAGTENPIWSKPDTPASGEPPEASKPIASPPNLFFLAYLVFLLFNIIRNTTGEVRHESLVTIIGYIAMLFIPFAAVAAYNLVKADTKVIGKTSIGITAFFLIFSMVVELENAANTRQRLNECQGMVKALGAQQAAAPNYLPAVAPPSVVSRESKLAVPVKGSVSLKMDSEPMKTVFLVNPAIARVATISPYELRVMGVKKGVTSLSIKDRAGYKFAYEIYVE